MGTSKKISLWNREGILGMNGEMPNLHLQKFNCGRKIIIIMCSDGISVHFTEEGLPLNKSAQNIADFIMENYRRQYGDATVLVAKRKR